jgi:hypothetical protein
MKKIKTTYWIFTGLLAAFILLSAIPDILCVPDAIAIVTTHLGYPIYIIRFLGVAKLLAAIAILFPGYPRLKEWAYAGFFFDLTGALYSSVEVGDPFTKWLPIFIAYFVLFSSYIYYHKKKKHINKIN